jgi:error-prone DNA polymerase
VIHVVADELTDLSDLLASVGRRGAPFPVPRGRGDQVTQGGGPDSRELLGRRPRDIYVPDIHIDTLKVKSRDFH